MKSLCWNNLLLNSVLTLVVTVRFVAVELRGHKMVCFVDEQDGPGREELYPKSPGRHSSLLSATPNECLRFQRGCTIRM